MPGAQIWDIVERLPRLLWPSDYYPFMLFHISPSHSAGGNMEHMKHNYMDLGVVVKGMGA